MLNCRALFILAATWLLVGDCSGQTPPIEGPTKSAPASVDEGQQPAAKEQQLAVAEALDRKVAVAFNAKRYAEAEPLCRQALEIRKQVLGEKHPHYATSLNNLASVYIEQGAYARAEPLCRQALEIQKQVLGEEHPDYAWNLNLLAGVYSKQADYARAEPLYRQALEIKKKEVGEQHPSYAESLNNLASVYYKQADYTRAEPLYLQALEIRKQVLGEKHPDYAWSLNNLAIVYAGQADYARAEPLFRQALEIRRQVLGEKHPQYATSLGSLAEAYRAQRDYARAEPLYRQASEIIKQVLGEKHPNYAKSLVNLATVYYDQADYARAEPLLRQALEIEKKVVGEQHPRYATSLNNLAGVYYKQADYTRAEPLFRQALEIRKQVLGEGHPDYANSLSSLASMYFDQADYARAERLHRQASEIVRHALGKLHPDYASSLYRLASVHNEQGDYARAEPLFRQALEIQKQVIGEKHPDYAATLNNLANVYHDQADYARAEPLYRQALEIWKQALGEKHPESAKAMNNLADIYKGQRDHIRAELVYRQVSETLKQALGENHPDYAFSLCNLANVYYYQSDYARAEPLYRQALEIRKQVLGEIHPDYASSLVYLASVYHAQADYARAEPLYSQALEIQKQVLGEQHPAYAGRLIDNALLQADLDRPAEGLRLLKDATTIIWNTLDRTAAVQSDRQQLAMAQDNANYPNDLLSLARLSNAKPDEFYPAVLPWKGQVLLRQQSARQLRAAAADPNSPIEQTFRALTEKTQQLSRLAEQVPPPAQREGHFQKLEQLTRDVEDLQQELSRLSAAYRQSREQIRRTPADLVACLPPQTALIDLRRYSQYNPHQTDRSQRYEQQYVAFVIRREEAVEVVWLGAAKPIDEAVTAWRDQREADPNTDMGQTLRELVWKPLKPHLADITTVLVSPDGALNQLPWGALPGSQPGTYLLAERMFVTIPVPLQLPDLLQRSGAPAENPSLLALGDVDYDARSQSSQEPLLTSLTVPANLHRGAAEALNRQVGEGSWQSLPGTAVEQRSIAALHEQLFPQAVRHMLSQRQAGEAQVRQEMPTATCVHLATHGYFAPEKFQSLLENSKADFTLQAGSLSGTARQHDVAGYVPGLLSGLVLAGANHPANDALNDGILTASEVETLSLQNSRLVVLSACETGLGKSAGGEGVLGLQRAFQLAGTQSVVASLWKVDDAATQALMEEFYVNLWDRKLSTGEALRQAQLKMLKDYDPKTGQLRGVIAKLKPDTPPATTPAKPTPTEAPRGPVTPFYWAAFVLSGDWR